MNYDTPVTPTTPANGATNVADTDSFTWQPAAKPQVYSVRIGETNGTITVYTATPKVDIARLKLGQILLTPGGNHVWSVGIGGYGSTGVAVDDIVSPTPLNVDNTLQTSASSAQFSFTSAP